MSIQRLVLSTEMTSSSPRPRATRSDLDARETVSQQPLNARRVNSKWICRAPACACVRMWTGRLGEHPNFLRGCSTFTRRRTGQWRMASVVGHVEDVSQSKKRCLLNRPPVLTKLLLVSAKTVSFVAVFGMSRALRDNPIVVA